jgi:hypothetical protein
MSTELSRKKVLEKLESFPAKLRRIALASLNRHIKPRLASPSFKNKHPKQGVSERELKEMRALKKAGASYRLLESVFKLVPHSGNGAQRAVRWADKLARKNARKEKRRSAVAA